MLLAITIFELSSGQTNKRDRKPYLFDFMGGGNEPDNQPYIRPDDWIGVKLLHVLQKTSSIHPGSFMQIS